MIEYERMNSYSEAVFNFCNAELCWRIFAIKEVTTRVPASGTREADTEWRKYGNIMRRYES